MTESFENSLMAIKEVIEPITSNWFLVGGACLGQVRSGNFIAHDFDLDIGIYEDDDKIEQILSALPVIKKWYHGNKLMEATLYFDCKVDVFFLRPYKGGVVEAVFAEVINRVRLYAYPMEMISAGIIKAEIGRIGVNMLRESRQYCKTLYGPDYHIERPNWNCWSDPYNIVFEDEIVSASSIESIRAVNAETINTFLRFCLKSIADTLNRNAQQNFEVSTSKSCLASIVFFYYYYRVTGDSVYYNLGNYLLSRYNDIVVPDEVNYTEGIVGYGVIVNHLCKCGFIEMEYENFFPAIDACAIEYIKENNINESHLEMIGVCTYLINRMESGVGLTEMAFASFRGFCLHSFVVIKEILLDNEWRLYNNKENNIDYNAELTISRSLIVMKKLLHNKFVVEVLGMVECQLIECSINERITEMLMKQQKEEVHMGYALLSGCAIFMGKDGSNLIDEIVSETNLFDSRNQTVSQCIFETGSYVKLCHILNKEWRNDFFFSYLNKWMFAENRLMVNPYSSFLGVEHIGMPDGLSIIGLLLTSLYDTDNLDGWNEILLLS